MRLLRCPHALAAVACVGIALGVAAGPAQAAAGDPVYVFVAPKTGSGAVPPGSGFNGLCGLAVDIAGNIYASDYYHHAVDVFNSEPNFQKQLANVDPVDGPCGLAVDSAGALYVNGFHRDVVRYKMSPFPLTPLTTFTAGVVVDAGEATGVAVHPGSNNLYVNNRTHVSVYDQTGGLIEDFGAGSLQDSYGIAYRNGRVFVADAGTDTVKVYEPTVNPSEPAAIIDGPPGGFESLVDSALAVDSVSGDLYVADRSGSRLTEHPEATVEVFDAAGQWKGHLKFNVVDGQPVGIAVDNSAGTKQGRVYVTSGNGEGASIYAYPPNSAITDDELPAVFSLSTTSVGSGSGAIAGMTGEAPCAETCTAEVSAGATVALRAAPAPGSSFAGWTGGVCTGDGECDLTMNGAKSVSAEFLLERGGPSAQIPMSGSGIETKSGSPPITTARKHHRRSKHSLHHRKHRRHQRHRR